FYVTRDDGQTWQNVTPADLPPGGRVQNIDASPHSASKAYFAVYRYLLGDYQPYIYKTEDYGKSWQRLTDGKNGIAMDDPVHVVREDPAVPGLLFAGTDHGVYVSYNDGKTWESLQQNLPVTPITDLKIHKGDLVLSTMGRGFWILDDMRFIRQGSSSVATKLYKPQDAYRMRYFARGGDIPVEYKQNGVIIDYVIGDTSSAQVLLEIRKGTEVVKSWKLKPEKAAKESKGYNLPIRPAYTTGHHRFLWNMQPDKASRGALVPPGAYTIELKKGDDRFTEDFYINLDPRVEASGVTEADLVEQYRLYQEISQLQQKANDLKARIEAEKKAIDPNALKGKKRLEAELKVDKLNLAIKELVTEEGRYMTPMLLDQIRYLASMISSADQRPGRDAYERLDQLFQWLSEVEHALD
ncbi:MAG: hypothetical protein KDC59_20895, partial [Saprospiraceae bacterium]|nr:hypothetical protein [Saprospiraceae bacterium]